MMLSGAPFGACDNSTRALDPVTALKFVQTLRLMAAGVSGSTHSVIIYRASQSIYDLFGKAVVHYEKYHIYPRVLWSYQWRQAVFRENELELPIVSDHR